MRRRAAMLMRSGSDVIIYTTNIDATERLPNVNLVPPDIPVRSVIVDRPNGPKQNDDGRDKENHGGVTSYDEQFQVELKNILDCDGRANVSVIDLKVS